MVNNEEGEQCEEVVFKEVYQHDSILILTQMFPHKV